MPCHASEGEEEIPNTPLYESDSESDEIGWLLASQEKFIRSHWEAQGMYFTLNVLTSFPDISTKRMDNPENAVNPTCQVSMCHMSPDLMITLQ